MPSNIDVSALSINEEEVKEISSIIMEEEFVNGVLADFHDIVTGVVTDKQILFSGRLADAFELAAGCVPAAGGAAVLTEKFWRPRIFSARWTHCADDVDRGFKAFQTMKRINPDLYDNISDPRGQFIMSLIGMSLRETLPHKVWFSDTAADDFAGGGVFTNGTNLDLYNVIDGLWVQILAEVGSGDSNYVEITENAGVSYAAQRLTGLEAFTYLGSVLEAADSRLLKAENRSNLVLLATRAVTDPYKGYVRTQNLGSGFLDVTIDGLPKLAFDGIPIVTRYDWDEFIDANQDNGTIRNLPNRILLTTKDNIPVGTLSESDLTMLDSFYDRTLKSNIIDVAYSLDAKFLQPYKAVAAY